MPLLRGCVVVATHDADGDLDGLSWQQLDLLVERSRALTSRDDRVLSRRIARDIRTQQRAEPGVPVEVGTRPVGPRVPVSR